MIRLVLALIAALLVGHLTFGDAPAQQAGKVFRVGYITGNNQGSEGARINGIKQNLRELGYIEGKNIAYEFRYHEGNRDRQGVLAAELVRLNVDLIVAAGGDVEIRAAMAATKTIPIIMTGRGSDPVRAGFIESLARPGANVTGLTTLNRELGGKRLELLKETMPKLTRVAAVYHAGLPGISREVNEDFAPLARPLGLSLHAVGVKDAGDFDRALSAITKNRSDGLYVSFAGTFMRNHAKRIGDFAVKSRLPASYDTTSVLAMGGLFYYGANLEDSYGRVAHYIDKILKGVKPAELPVEQPTKFDFIVNLKTAKQIGLTIPPNLLARATRIIR